MEYDLRFAERELRAIFTAPPPPEIADEPSVKLAMLAVDAKVHFALWLLRIENEGASPVEAIAAASSVLAGILINAGRNICEPDATVPLLAAVTAHVIGGDGIEGEGFTLDPTIGGRA